MYDLPLQRIPKSKKTKDWEESCVRAILRNADFSYRNEFEKLYNYYYSEKIDKKEYSYVENPLGLDTDLYKYPARIRNYNIIYPVVNLILGEKINLPFSPQVVVKNPDVKRAMEDKKFNDIKQALSQIFINAMNEQGVETNMESQEVDLGSIKRYYKSTYRDARAQMGQDALNYIIYEQELQDKFINQYLDFLITGTCYSYKCVDDDFLLYEDVSKFDFDYDRKANSSYIKDSSWAIRKSKKSINEILDDFGDLLTDEQYKELENRTKNIGSYTNFDEEFQNNELSVYHCVWRTMIQIGKLLTPDGQVIEVSEGYKPDTEFGEEVEWEWQTAVMEGYCIGEEFDGYIVGVQQLPVVEGQEGVSLPYNGIENRLRTNEIVSIVKLGIPFQLLYSIIKYNMELAINKNKGKIALVDINVLPDKPGWSEDRFMYYADSSGYMFVDGMATTDDGANYQFDKYQVLDLSLSDHINRLYELAEMIKKTYEDLVGVPRQRKGELMASDGKANTDVALYQSSLITAYINRVFNRYENKELQEILDLSKFAYRFGKDGIYITPEGREQVFSLGEGYSESMFGIFARNSARESQKLEQLRNAALAFAQNGSTPDVIAEIIDSEHFTEIKNRLRVVSDEMKQMQQQAQQAELERVNKENEAEFNSQKQLQDDKQQFEASENEKDRQLERELKGNNDNGSAEDQVAKDKELANKRYEKQMDYNIARTNRNKFG